MKKDEKKGINEMVRLLSMGNRIGWFEVDQLLVVILLLRD